MTSTGPRPLFNLYIDDSGTRNPDRKQDGLIFADWFGMGGMLIANEHEDEARRLHKEFCERWTIDYPLHSVKIRGRTGSFLWLETRGKETASVFYQDLADLIKAMPVIGHACVIDRPGYANRYQEKYGRQQWSLCKTAFSVLCERAAKFAIKHDRRIKLFVERSDKLSDGLLKSYFKEMRDTGMPFSQDGSDKYGPLSPAELKYRLVDITFKTKECRMTQMADVLLYPLCRGAYDKEYRPFSHMQEHRKIVDLHIEENEIVPLGVKYSCFDAKPNAIQQKGSYPVKDGASLPASSGDLAGIALKNK